MPSIISKVQSISFTVLHLIDIIGIARSTLLLKYFFSVAENLLERMINQSVSKHMLLKQINRLKKHLTDIQRLFKNIILSL